jgi:hypothetical protein
MNAGDIMSKSLYFFGAVITMVTVAVIFVFLHTSVLSKRGLQEIEVTEYNNNQHHTIHIDGRLIGGMLAISSVEQYQKGSCIVMVVRTGITRPGLRNARFHYDIIVPNDVDQISFGRPADIVWRRKS